MPGKGHEHTAKPTGSARQRQPAQGVRVNEEPSGRLKLDQGLERGGRVGDPRPAEELDREYPPERGREGGKTGGEIAHGDLTADDASPDTLLDEDQSGTPSAGGRREPADSVLRGRDPATVGAGRGLDEAEMANVAPVGKTESERLRRKAHQHARDPNAFEPSEAAEQADRENVRDRDRRH